MADRVQYLVRVLRPYAGREALERWKSAPKRAVKVDAGQATRFLQESKVGPSEVTTPVLVSAYFLFDRDQRAKQLESQPYQNLGELTRIIESMWEQLDEVERQEYRNRSKVVSEKLLKGVPVPAAKPASVPSHHTTPTTEPYPPPQTSIASPSLPSNLQNMPINYNPSNPGRITAYLIFDRERRDAVVNANPQLKFGDISKIVGAMWRQMEQWEKDMYAEKARQTNYERQAIREGGTPGGLRRRNPGAVSQFHQANEAMFLKSVTCTVCRVTLSHRKSYKSHMQRSHPEHWDNEFELRCKLCQTKHKGNKALTAHFASAHPDLTSLNQLAPPRPSSQAVRASGYHCKLCQSFIPSSSDAYHHLQNHHKAIFKEKRGEFLSLFDPIA